MAAARQLAFETLRTIDRRQLYAEVAINQALQRSPLSRQERGLFTELVYGVIRQQRRLDCILEQLGDRPSDKQPPDLRRLVHLGLYQLSYCDQVPPSAAVNTTVQLAKENDLKGLSKVVNGMLRRYLRMNGDGSWTLPAVNDPIVAWGQQYSLPDWVVALFREQLTADETQTLCRFFNHPPHLDIRINPLKTDRPSVQQALRDAALPTKIIPGLPQSLRLGKKAGAIPDLPGFVAGHWTVQDASAQWVAPILDPQPGEVIFDVCAAPGGKTTHIAELMGDRGIIWAGDRTEWRLQKLQQAQQRLGLRSIKTWCGDLTAGDTPPILQVDRALLDVPCSGLGTLHRNPDLRWRQSPHKIVGLMEKQAQLLQAIAPLVKPGGILVYATCTLNPAENTAQVEKFLAANPQWHPQTFQWLPPQTDADYCTQTELTLWPHLTEQDGFFIAKMIKH